MLRPIGTKLRTDVTQSLWKTQSILSGTRLLPRIFNRVCQRVQSKGRSRVIVASFTLERPFDCTRISTISSSMELSAFRSGCSTFL